MWKVVLVLMVLTNAEQRLIVQQPLDGHGFATKAECDKFAEGWRGQTKQPELQRLAEARAPAFRGNMKTVSLLDAGCADPGWSGAFPILKADEGFPPAADKKPGEAKPAH
ncbi:MAG: hypothetical protein ACT4N4_08735 [Rhodospirillales bacterium]